MDCFSNTIVNGESGASKRRQIILYNELDRTLFEPIGPRAAQVEPCIGIKFDVKPYINNLTSNN